MLASQIVATNYVGNKQKREHFRRGTLLIRVLVAVSITMHRMAQEELEGLGISVAKFLLDFDSDHARYWIHHYVAISLTIHGLAASGCNSLAGKRTICGRAVRTIATPKLRDVNHWFMQRVSLVYAQDNQAC